MFTNEYTISIIQVSKWLNLHINSFSYYFLISDSGNIYAAPTVQYNRNTKKDQTRSGPSAVPVNVKQPVLKGKRNPYSIY